jgi:predicted dehydrogenase
VPSDAAYLNEDDFFNAGVLGDGLVIASMDHDHYRHVMKALNTGYKYILLEKPVSDVIAETEEIARVAKEKGTTILVCHVLRYSRFYKTIHDIIVSGRIGEPVTINHEENIAYWHFAHSFVRGNWRNAAVSHPLLYAKTCHDFDLLYWFANSKFKSAKSFGSLKYFIKENAPENCADRCLDGCKYLDSCAYSVKNLYFDTKSPLGWGLYPAIGKNNPTQSERYDALKRADNPYGRCVYKCDNDLDDHKSVLIEFQNGVTATLNVTAFSKDCHRRIHIMGTHGEILGDDADNYITVNVFGQKKKGIFDCNYNKVKIGPPGSGHLGGDTGICDSFVKIIAGKPVNPDYLTTIDVTLEGHRIVDAAEHS